MIENLPGAAYDNKIYAKFSKNTIEKKQQNKDEFCEEFDLACDKRQLLIGVVSELSAKNKAEILEDILPGIASLKFCLAVRAVGSEKFQKILQKFADENPGKVALVGDGNDALRKILAAADVSFHFHNGEENEQFIQASLLYAALPVAPKSAEHVVEDYNPNQESGNGFLFDSGNYWCAFSALVRANENFRFPYDWKTIQKTALDH